MELEGRTGIVTGGGRGIGREVARSLAKAGVRLLLVARSEGELEEAKRSIGAEAGRVEIYAGDVSWKETAQKIVGRAADLFGGVDILVNAAGIYGAIGNSHEVDFGKWKETFVVNTFGTFNMVQEVISLMIVKKSGTIINFSGGGDGPLPNFSAYNASKAAVVRLTETLAQEFKPYGVRINAVAPGPVNTRILEDALAAGERSVGAEMYAKLLRQKEEGGVPPERTAELCVFLASDRSFNLSGKLISAVWDDWKSWDKKMIEELMRSNKLNLRRVPWRTE